MKFFSFMFSKLKDKTSLLKILTQSLFAYLSFKFLASDVSFSIKNNDLGFF